jgi:hypothetical protein
VCPRDAFVKRIPTAFLTFPPICDALCSPTLLKIFSALILRDREIWKKLDAEPADAILDSVYDFLDQGSTFGSLSCLK